MSSHRRRTRQFIKDRLKAEAKPKWNVAELMHRLQRATDQRDKAYEALEPAVVRVHALLRTMCVARAEAMFSHDPEVEQKAERLTQEYSEAVADHLNCLAEHRAKRVAFETLNEAMKMVTRKFAPEISDQPPPGATT